MKKHTLATFAFAALAAFASFGGDADGNIRSIDAMPQYAKSIIFPNATAPLQAGQEVYILVRLLNYDWAETQRGDEPVHPWYFARSASAAAGSGSVADSTFNAPALGISVGGVPRQAVFTAKGPNGEESGANGAVKWYTDLYFVYTVQPGDIGLPIKILNSTGRIPATDADNTDYLLYNANTAGTTKYAAWDLTTDALDDSGNKPLAQFHYGPENPSDPATGATPGYPAGQPHAEAHRSFDLASEGVYIRTLDFDGDYADGASDPKIWREVQLGTDEPYTVSPSVVGAVTGAVVYVWSEDDAIVVPTPQGDAVYHDDGTGRKVLAVTVRDGRGVFGLKGAGAVGSTTKIYMGSTTSEGYSKVGDKLENSACMRTVKVREAPKPHITVSSFSDETKFSVTATTNYEAATEMKVAVSERFGDGPIAVKLNPRFLRGNVDVPLSEADPVDGAYVRILTDRNDPTVSTGVSEITIPAGEKEATFYLYALGAPSDRTMNKLLLAPTIEDPDTWAHYSGGNNKGATITLSDQAPIVTTPADGALYNAFDGDVIPDFNVGVTDNWRDLQPTLNAEGYTVTVTFPNGGQAFSQTGVHFTDGVAVTLPVKAPAEGTYPAIITVKDPAGHTGTREVTVKAAHALEAKIKAYRDEQFTEAYPDGYIFKEGENPWVRVELSSPATAQMYAFLRPENDAARDLVSCENVSTGLSIDQSDTVSAGVQIGFLDGYSAGSPMRARFKVGLKSTEAFDAPTAIDYTSTYAPRTREFAVVNVSPWIKDGTMCMSTTYVKNGEKLTAKAPAGSPVIFKANVADPSPVDLKATGDDAVWARWVYSDGPEGSKSDRVRFTTIANGRVSCPITFNEEGQEQTVRVYLLDKDDRKAQPDATEEEDYDWGEAVYTFTVEVSQSATVNILDANGVRVGEEGMFYNETDSKQKAFFYIQLSTPPSDAGTADGSQKVDANHPIKVQIEKENWGSDGTLNLETDIVTVFNGDKKKVFFDALTLDGGYETLYQITARVITDDMQNAYNQTWKDFYQPSSAEVTVYNVDPVISLVKRLNGKLTDTGTNDWSAGESIRLKWSVKDVIPDVTSGSFTLSWSIDSTDPATYPNPLTIAPGTPYTLSGSKIAVLEGEYEFNVPDIEDQVLTLVVEDGDGGRAEKKWYIHVSQTKKIAISPAGPMDPSDTKYRRASGRGRGHVYVDGSTGPSTAIIRDFVQTWNFNEASRQAGVTAAGYPAVTGDAFDNGAIGNPDYTGAPLSPNGGRGTPGNYYNYGNSAYDNYFYCWALIGGENGTTLLSPIPAARSKTHLFDLDNEKPEKGGSYKTVQVEAIFSREFLPSDNMGDINADGVPDVYALTYPGLGVFNEAGERAGDDLARIDNGNVDEDYLPNTPSAGYAPFIPGAADSWVMQGRAFTTRMEIRGFDDHFNDAPKQAGVKGVACEIVYTDPTTDKDSTLSFLEYVAFTNWCGRQEAPLDPADRANWWSKWSPERPTDPTLADTDGDGMPDGYEYYFWYKAHVGYFSTVTGEDGTVTTNYQRLTGRKYNPSDPCHPFAITADEIERLYDPLVANHDLATIDTDNDGIPDLLELELGTNPFDYDTDGDGLPDGYEVMLGKGDGDTFISDPLKYATRPGTCDADRNDDGDQMASISVRMAQVSVEFADRTNTCWVLESDAAKLAGVEPADLAAGSAIRFFTTWTYKGDELALGRLVYDTANPENLAELQGAAAFAVAAAQPVRALHYQVYTLKGFDPRVAWNPAPAFTGHRVDTDTFTTYDEFMLLAFFRQTGGLNEADVTQSDGRTFQAIWTDFTTSPASADTDGDAMPDGWELYVMAGPGVYGGVHPQNIYSPLSDYANIKGTPAENPDLDILGNDRPDGLGFDLEWCGVECCSKYPNCPTIVNLNAEWKNKIWPTDPWAWDTDGDGLSDGEERTWIFGNAEHTQANFEDCVEGGGLNPLSWDTDGDGLPDPWELEFRGTVVQGSANTSVETTTGTNGATSVTNTVSTGAYAAKDGMGMNPTTPDAYEDYDSDGLLNWQEYMVGAMRCWRYDDVTSPWVAHQLTSGDVEAHMTDDDWWGHVLVERWLDDENAHQEYNGVFKGDQAYEYNPGLRNGHFDPGVYFSCCRLPWELNAAVSGRFYMFKDGVDHDLMYDLKSVGDNQYNRWTYTLQSEVATWSDAPLFSIPSYPSRYICCDPRKADTDGDGLDDYYELYHGLNPLLGLEGSDAEDGPCDVVYRAWKKTDPTEEPPSAKANYWLNGPTVHNGTLTKGPDDVRLKHEDEADPAHSIMDFYQFPWLAGLPDADPDGDNIRNQQEGILPKVQAAPTYQHTDPTPLWMTDTAYTNSLTHRFYQVLNPAWASTLMGPIGVHPTGRFTYKGKTYSFNDFPWLSWNARTSVLSVGYSVNRWNSRDTMFSYEENEGYDSDHDYLSDFEESQGKTKNSSDPQQHDDPLRHQAMWFNGTDAFLQTPLAVRHRPPTDKAGAEERQNLLHFTVEAWVKPDAGIVSENGLYTVLERPIWTGESNPADESFLRKNFLVGVWNGRWYARFDSSGTDLNQPVEITNGPIATTNWTHVAVTYGPADGDETNSESPMALRLYVDGTLRRTLRTALQPEHGTSAVRIDKTGAFVGQMLWGHLNDKPMISLLVGASAATMRGIAFEYGWETRFQVPGETQWPHVSEANVTTLDDYKSFFKGYIDEVRIWDGARSSSDIQKDFKSKTRYTSALAAANRQQVYEAWRKGALRSPTSGDGIKLPPELMYHWSFDHLPGAARTRDVLKTPAGFATAETVTDAKAVLSRPKGWVNDRWNSAAVRSTVYADNAWVPWINNTVSHLPNIDGTTADSVYWSEDYAGAAAATSLGYASFAFPRSAEVWSSEVQQAYVTENAPFSNPTRWNIVSTNDDLEWSYRFNLRNRETVGKDLLPMGGAYPKRISSAEGGMWHDGKPADAWAETGADNDNNGLPDWWEAYARRNYANVKPWEEFGWNTSVTYGGVTMPAWQAYLRDLAKGMLTDGKYHPEYADTRDADGDGIPDWWEDLYGVNTHSASDAYADPDGDGLSNYAEYLISEVFKFAVCDPLQYATDNGVCDYFKKVGDLYLGEIFTDHDQVDDAWESKYGVDYANRCVYDPLGDADGDGWSNYAEFRAGTDPSCATTTSIDGYSRPEYPVPAIAANVIYNGANLIDKPLVFKAWSEKTDPDMLKAPDAVWTLGSTGTAAEGSDLVSREKFIGHKPTGEHTFYLSGGNVSEGSVKLLFLDKGYGLVRYDEASGKVQAVASGDPDSALWVYRIYDNRGKLMRTGSAFNKAFGVEDPVVGSIDYRTGKVTIDFSHEELSGQVVASPADSESSGNAATDGLYHYIDLDNAYVRITWKASAAYSTGPGLRYLCDADERSDKTRHLREGRNTFVCFVDEDGNGEYTAGEPFGVVRGVDVGWSGAAFDVELTETHPIFGRVDMAGNNDRAVWYGSDSGNLEVLDLSGGDSSTGDATTGSGETLPNGGRKIHVRVDRYAVNGVQIGTSSDQVPLTLNRVLLDKWLTIGARAYIHEGDFLENGAFDIDWDYLTKDVVGSPAVLLRFEGGEVNSVSYRVVIDNEEFIHPMATNKVLSVAFTRTFDKVQQKAQGLEAMLVYGARPTFRWTTNGLNSYTAFKLRILDSAGTVVYESAMTRMPAVDAENRYTWKAPFFVGDQTPQGRVLEHAGNYKWCVSLYNAKFRKDLYCDAAPFTTFVGQQGEMDDYGYGRVSASVKYAGPPKVLERCESLSSPKGIVRIQAFETADFAGVPEAQTFVTNRASLVDTTNLLANVTLRGLRPGTYYLRAYIDSDGDFEKDDWESWGRAKASVAVVAGKTSESVEIWIEDADIDGDWLPDAWEYATYGNLTTKNATVDPNGEIVLRSTTYAALMNVTTGASATPSGSSLTLFQNIEAARLLLGLGSDASADSAAAVRAAVEKRIKPDTVKITSLDIDAADPVHPQVVLTVGAEVADTAAGNLLSPAYSLPTATTVKLRVYKKASLVDASWSWVKDVPVTVSTVLDEPVRVDVGEDFSSGFFKVDVVQ